MPIILAAIVTVAVAILLIVLFCRRTNIPASSCAVLKYRQKEKSVVLEMTKEDSEELRRLLNHRFLYYDNPSCGFTQGVSISFDDSVYCFACDGCNVIYDCESQMYFTIKQTEYDGLADILLRYGLTFPCI